MPGQLRFYQDAGLQIAQDKTDFVPESGHVDFRPAGLVVADIDIAMDRATNAPSRPIRPP
jgi:hypothetical protein